MEKTSSSKHMTERDKELLGNCLLGSLLHLAGSNIVSAQRPRFVPGSSFSILHCIDLTLQPLQHHGFR
jgi:hypothetical protein